MGTQASKFGRIVRVFCMALACAGFLEACGGAGASPPVSIPAPVAGLISITSPSDAGQVRLAGAAGAAQDGATLTVSFPSGTSGFKTQDTVTTTVATSSGSFGADFGAGIGDTFEVTQTVGGETSPPITVTVIEGRPLLSSIPLGTATSESFSIGCALFISGSDTTLGCFSLSTFAEAAVTVTSFIGSDLAIDDFSGDFYLIANASSEAIVVDAFGTLKGGILGIPSPLAVAADQDLNFAVVVQDDSFTSMTMIDNTDFFTPVLDATALITHPTDGGATHVRSISVSADHDGLDEARFAVLSEFDNGDTIFSFVTATPPPGGILSVSSQVNLGSAQFDSVNLFNAATEAVVSDTTNNQIIHLSGLNFATQTPISVGLNPRGMAISESLAFAFVCNRDDHTVSIVDLLSDQVVGTMTTLNGVGLGPTDIAVNPSPFIGVISNQTDSTATLFDINNVLTALGII